MKEIITIDQDKVFSRLTSNAKRIIISAYDLARKDISNSEGLVEARHLFVAILLEHKNQAARLLEKLNVDLNGTAKAIMDLDQAGFTSKSLLVGEDLKKALAEAFIESAELKHVYVGSEHILLALMKMMHLAFVKDLNKAGLDYEKVKRELLSFGSYHPGVFARGQQQTNPMDGYFAEASNAQANPGPSILEYFGRSMNSLAKEGRYSPIFGREKEIERLIHILSRQSKNNPILVGEPGVGKTAIIEGFVQKIIAGQVPRVFADWQIIQLDMASIIAGAKIRGDVEERLLGILNEVQKSPNKILFIDEIHTIVGSSGGGTDIVNLLKPYLTSSDLRIIGATTADEYRRYFEEDGALARRFQPIIVDELSVEATTQLLQHTQKRFEDYHGVKITPEAIVESVKLAKRYVTNRYLPDKAIDLLDEAAAGKKISRETLSTSQTAHLHEDKDRIEVDKNSAWEKGNVRKASELRLQEMAVESIIRDEDAKSKRSSKRYKVELEDVRAVVSAWTKIPVSSLDASDVKVISDIKHILESKIIGQNDAITRISAAVKRAKLGLSEESRPLASFLFLGPTGIGKTETAKVIAKEIFGNEDALIQVNMSEFMEQHTVSKIIGAPPGYIGYQDGNHLTEKVRKNPYCVALFDEIEKAHPDVLNILLQVLEEGELQDGRGRKVNFKNTIIILTSNIGAQEIAEDRMLGFSVDFGNADEDKLEEAYDLMRKGVLADLKEYLRPEFINRLDEIIVFRGLNQSDALQISKLLVDNLNMRLQDKHINLIIGPKLLKKIAVEGFSKEFGARNLKRKLQELVENELADFLLTEKLLPQIQRRQKKHFAPLQITGELVGKRADKPGGEKVAFTAGANI